MIHQLSPRTESNRKNKSPMQKLEIDSQESELSEAKKAVSDLALKIEKRSKDTRKPRWRQQQQEPEPEPEPASKYEDVRFAQVMQQLDHMKHELRKLKLDMARVLKQKRHAEISAKASNSKASTLSASIELIKNEIRELNEEQLVAEFARIEAVKERESIESQRKQDENRFKTQILEAKTNQLQIILSDINLQQQGSPILDELETAKRELAEIKREGFGFMKSMDVIRDELKHVRDEKTRFQIAEQKREITVQNLNSKILRAKARLDSLTSAETKTNLVVSNLVLTLDQLRAEVVTSRTENDHINEEIENVNGEIRKTEFEMEVMEERLEEAMEELKNTKLSESKALENLKDLVKSVVESRDSDLTNGSKITVSGFEYEYLTGTAGLAAELADKKIRAAEAWVEALKANEREILMRVEFTERESSELSIEAGPREEEEEEVDEPDLEARVADESRKSMYRVGSKASVKRAKVQRLRTSIARYSGKPGSTRKEVVPKVGEFF